MERATSLLTDILDKRHNVKFTPEVIWVLFMILATACSRVRKSFF